MRHQLVVLASVLLPLLLSPATGTNVWIPGAEGGNVEIRSIQERKFDHVVRQQYDFSCGSAALATLLSFHYADPTTEEETFTAMYEKGDQAKIAKVGFSLLDMKAYLQDNGYQADGYQASLDTLAQAGVAAIALINYRGYQHFVVVKGLQGGEVLVGDPALGMRVVSRPEFESTWPTRILFIIKNKSTVGQQYFNAGGEWQAIARAPLGMAISRESLAGLTLTLPTFGMGGTGDF